MSLEWDIYKRKMVKTGKQRASRSAEPPCSAPLRTVHARYRDLLQRLGCCSHDGAIKEIACLRHGNRADADARRGAQGLDSSSFQRRGSCFGT